MPITPNANSPAGRMLTERLTPPIDADPAAIKGPFIEQHEGLLGEARRAAAGMFKVWQTTEDIRDRVTDKPLLASKVQQAVERSLRDAEPKINRLRERRDAEYAKVKATFNTGDKDTLGAEIRADIKARQGKAASAVSELITAGDQRSVAAVLAAPPALSGLTRKQHDSLRDIAERMFAPEGIGLVADLDRAIGRLEQTTQAMGETIAPLLRHWRGEDEALIKELESNG